jgi:hypothetical protein
MAFKQGGELTLTSNNDVLEKVFSSFKSTVPAAEMMANGWDSRENPSILCKSALLHMSRNLFPRNNKLRSRLALKAFAAPACNRESILLLV